MGSRIPFVGLNGRTFSLLSIKYRESVMISTNRIVFIALAINHSIFITFGDAVPCKLRKFDAGFVCVCNATYCDTLEFQEPTEDGKYLIVSTSEDGLRFRVDEGNFRTTFNDRKFEPQVLTMNEKSNRGIFNDLINENEVTINVDSKKTYQTIVGFGGAFTGAVSHNLDTLDPKLTESLYKSYYSKNEGIAYNIMRIPIGGCDFDVAPWAYNESPENDTNLTNFKELDPRDLRRIEQLNRLKEVTGNVDIKFMGAAWSPPPWMKTNNAWTGRGNLKDEYYQTWADYHIKYLELMKEAGVDYWAISTGNEPMNGEPIIQNFVPFMSLGWTPWNQGKWVGNNLGPALKNSKNVNNVKLFGGDDQRYTFPIWFTQMNAAFPNATNYLDGLAVHWYWDFIIPPYGLNEAHRLFPDKLIINTESCLGDKPWNFHGPILGSWTRAESYIWHVMQDLQNSVNGWIDWNLVLDEVGGPNYVKNFVETPIVVNTTSNQEAYKQPIFHVLGHFSRFIPENSVRIRVRTSNVRVVDVVGFMRPDKKIALVFYNKKPHPVRIIIKDPIRGRIYLNVPSKSLHSILYLK